ncbi:MAG: type II toxin-antitoxin system HicA family toxin [Candidatus Pacearchaeota archaeon]
MRLPQISGHDLIKILSKFGFVTTRQKGSHVRLEKGEGRNIIKITVPLHDRLKKGTLLSIIKSSKIGINELEKFF